MYSCCLSLVCQYRLAFLPSDGSYGLHTWVLDCVYIHFVFVALSRMKSCSLIFPDEPWLLQRRRLALGIFILCQKLLPDLLMVLNSFMIHSLGLYWTSTMTIWKRCVFFFPYIPRARSRLPRKSEDGLCRDSAWRQIQPSNPTNAVDDPHGVKWRNSTERRRVYL